MEVTAEVSRSGAWWAVEVPEVPGAFTQAERLDRFYQNQATGEFYPIRALRLRPRRVRI